jgi:glycosyltransferase involved in cell wall biosynthesis
MTAPLIPQRLRILAVAAHPVQYQAPLFRRLAAREDVELQVAYCSLRGAEAGHDPEFGTTVQWDVPLLEGYSWTHAPNRGNGGEGFWGLCNHGIWKMIRASDFDAVFCYTGYLRATFWIAYAAAKLSGSAFLFGTDAVSLDARSGRAWKRGVKRILWPVLFRLADQVIVLSSGTRELMTSLGIAKERVTLTPYVVDNDWWAAASAQVDRAAVRSSWGAAPDEMVILFCAKLRPWKRPADLLRAFAKADLGNARLVFAGEGPLRADLEAEAVALGVAERVRFLGFVNQTGLPPVYTASDLLVLPSEYEPFAVVVNEAMCCGCMAAVSDRVGAGPDLVAPVRRDFIFPCGDVAALANLLGQAAKNRKSLRELGAAARTRMNSWSPDENIEATVEAARIAARRVGRTKTHSEGSLVGASDGSVSKARRL